MKNINTRDELEYAASISPDELTLYFTRARIALAGNNMQISADTKIMVAKRSSKTEPFGRPELISSVTGYVESPAISSDGNTLYFHKMYQGKFTLFRVSLSSSGSRESGYRAKLPELSGGTHK